MRRRALAAPACSDVAHPCRSSPSSSQVRAFWSVHYTPSWMAWKCLLRVPAHSCSGRCGLVMTLLKPGNPWDSGIKTQWCNQTEMGRFCRRVMGKIKHTFSLNEHRNPSSLSIKGFLPLWRSSSVSEHLVHPQHTQNKSVFSLGSYWHLYSITITSLYCKHKVLKQAILSCSHWQGWKPTELAHCMRGLPGLQQMSFSKRMTELLSNSWTPHDLSPPSSLFI